MQAHIYIHANGEIVEKFVIDYDSVDDLREIADYAATHYKNKDGYCLDIMIL